MLQMVTLFRGRKEYLPQPQTREMHGARAAFSDDAVE
jgi:hypothetical protein